MAALVSQDQRNPLMVNQHIGIDKYYCPAFAHHRFNQFVYRIIQTSMLMTKLDTHKYGLQESPIYKFLEQID